MNQVLSLGDCNTLGEGECKGNAYPEQFAHLIGQRSCNCGYTMSTTREARYFFSDYYASNTNVVTLQYGLVDSWETFVWSPYVLYYPDNILRKIARKIVKKYKKVCRRMGLHEKIGKSLVVNHAEFTQNLTEIIRLCRPETHIFLVETVPNQSCYRNPAIQEYNQLIRNIASTDSRCHLIQTYDYFMNNMDTLYADKTHVNLKGHQFIASKLAECYEQILLAR